MFALDALPAKQAFPSHTPTRPQFNARACRFGSYPWDDWERFALWRGLDAGMANLGAEVIREAYNHGWESWLQRLCGWGDNGRAMLALGLKSPKLARWCWSRLMETDGLRGDVPPSRGSGATGIPGTGQWTWGYVRPDSRRVALTLLKAMIRK